MVFPLTNHEWRLPVCARLPKARGLRQTIRDQIRNLLTVVGFTRDELRAIHGKLCAEFPPDKEMKRAIGQCLNNVAGFPAPKGSASRWVAAADHEVDALCEKWFCEIEP